MTRVVARVLSDLRPAARAALMAAADRSAWYRVVVGLHYPTDLAGARVLADAAHQKMTRSPWFRAAFTRAASATALSPTMVEGAR